MAEPLKEMFNEAYYRQLAASVHQVYPEFNRKGFLSDVLIDLNSLELNARMRRTSETLHRYLPMEFRDCVDVLRKVIVLMPKGYTALVFPDFVGLYGLDDPGFSLEALKYFTAFGSSEFAVREFLRQDLKSTLATMREWAEHPDEHVRRLASEGCRPRLPWSFRLDAVVKASELTIPILETLRKDPSPYVRKSVANHLNDISKDHPAVMLDVLERWDLDHPATAWIAKHACRNLIKQGDPRALSLFAFTREVNVTVEDLFLQPAILRLGEVVELSFSIRSKAERTQKLVVDQRVHFCKAHVRSSQKVFKLKEIVLESGRSMMVKKRQRIQDLSTRKHYAGMHRVEIIVNGQVLGTAQFELVI